MLRMESDTGWSLITHPDHARLAGAFAAAWGNAQFRRPEPRARVLHGIASHDDGWAARDAHPAITREGEPSAFSAELVGKYSAFEEIDPADYLVVRERAVRIIAEQDPYAGLLIAMHTFNLLTAHADRSTIAPEGLVLLDAFLERQQAYQRELLAAIEADASLALVEKSSQTILEHLHLLQACDNLSLLTCVAFSSPANLLHPCRRTTAPLRRCRCCPWRRACFAWLPGLLRSQSFSFTFRPATSRATPLPRRQRWKPLSMRLPSRLSP
ncbi:MAG TPA: DUF3891 family protein [Terracidiphilus sp.]|nr:DUF3891 family protein [Terracidiphilus sp.]